MARERKKELIRCEFFAWRIGVRSNDFYYADGRSNEVDLGRHSLGTKDRDEAFARLKDLDRQLAVEFKFAPAELGRLAERDPLRIDEGVELYMKRVHRPAVSGGTRPATPKRYRAVFDKFRPVMKAHGIRFWVQVNADVLHLYAQWLEDHEKEYATQYLELTTIRQAMNWLIEDKRIPETCRFSHPMEKPDGTDTYCYAYEEVGAMVARCTENSELQWLADVIVGLAHTGLRLSELAGLRWSDFDLATGVLRLPDRSRRGTRDERAKARTTKGKRERILPIHRALGDRLKAMKRHPDGRVFHGPRLGILKPDTVRNILIRDVINPLAARFPSPPGEPGFKDGRLHSFRHYFCSSCANAGIPEQMLMGWLGHRDSAMVKRYYHASRDEALRQMNRIEFSTLAADESTAVRRSEAGGGGGCGSERTEATVYVVEAAAAPCE